MLKSSQPDPFFFFFFCWGFFDQAEKFSTAPDIIFLKIFSPFLNLSEIKKKKKISVLDEATECNLRKAKEHISWHVLVRVIKMRILTQIIHEIMSVDKTWNSEWLSYQKKLSKYFFIPDLQLSSWKLFSVFFYIESTNFLKAKIIQVLIIRKLDCLKFSFIFV